MRRALAVVAAAAMVAGALAIRDRMDDNEREKSQTLRLACASELEAVCNDLKRADDRIEVTVEAAGATARRLEAFEGDIGNVGLDGWLVSAPWPDIVDGARQGRALEPIFGPDASRPVLARSPLVLVGWKDRLAVLAERCGGPAIGWKCVGEAAGTPGGWGAIGGRPEWGDVKPGHASPETDVGLLVLGQASADWFGRADLSTLDLDDENFGQWFAALERAVRGSGGSPLGVALVTGPAAYDVVGTVEAEAVPLLARSARSGQLDVLYPASMATADLVMATPSSGGGPSESLRALSASDDARKALTGAGWKVPGAGAPAPALPSPGLLAALKLRWHSVTGR